MSWEPRKLNFEAGIEIERNLYWLSSILSKYNTRGCILDTNGYNSRKKTRKNMDFVSHNKLRLLWCWFRRSLSDRAEETNLSNKAYAKILFRQALKLRRDSCFETASIPIKSIIQTMLTTSCFALLYWIKGIFRW